MTERTTLILRFSLIFALALCGGYVILAYTGVPIHQQVLVETDLERQDIAASCASDAYLCMGWKAIVPSIVFAISRLSPFLAYAIISLLGLAALFGLGYMRTNEWRLRFTLSPWKVIALFLASVWLLFTTLSFGTDGQQAFRTIFEPVPQVYVGSSPQALKELKVNFDKLKEDGCLTYVGQTNNGAGVYDYAFSCMQVSFVTRVLTQAVFIILLLFNLIVLGRQLLTLMRSRPTDPLIEATMSLGIGACGLIAILWLIALAGIYTANTGWVLMLAIPAIGWRHALYWLRQSVERRWTVEASWQSGVVILAWLLISYLALNFLHVIRPFPIGWDDLGRYLNQPRLLVSYGHFIPTLASFQWEYITSLGFLLFGYDSTFGATAAMQINWMAGVIAILVIYAFGRTFLGPGRGLLAALVYYSLPMVGHFSFADMKVDNAVFAVGSLSLLCGFLYAFETQEEADEHPDEAPRALNWRWLVLAGIFAGFALSLKPTSVMVILGMLTVIAGAGLGWLGFLAAFLLGWAIYAFDGRLNPGDILARMNLDPMLIDRTTLLGVLLILAATALGYAIYLRKDRLRSTGAAVGIFVAATIASTLPWLLYNNAQYGRIIPSLTFTAPNTFTPIFDYVKNPGPITDFGQAIRSLPDELRVDGENPACKSTSKSEELDRYWGYRTDWSHYITLPWRAVMNIDAAGYYVTLAPALLFLPFILLLPYAWSRRGRWSLWLAAVTGFILLQWVIFGNGIPWYGIGMFLGLCIIIETLAFKSPDRTSRTIAGVLIGLSTLFMFSMRMWQYEQQNNLFEYPLGKVSAETMRERTIPHYDDIREVIMDRHEALPDRPYVYRVGTFIPYFIPKNLEILAVADHQLDMFNCINQEGDPALTMQRLRTLGFNSIIFDTNTQTIERDPNGSLHKKVQRFLDFLNNPSTNIQVVVNDPEGGIVYVLIP